MTIKPNFIIAIIATAAIVLGIWYFGNETLYNYIQKDLKKENTALKLQIEELQEAKQKEVIKYRYISDQKQNKKDETTHTTNAVYTLNERELDSTIRAYKFTPRK